MSALPYSYGGPAWLPPGTDFRTPGINPQAGVPGAAGGISPLLQMILGQTQQQPQQQAPAPDQLGGAQPNFSTGYKVMEGFKGVGQGLRGLMSNPDLAMALLANSGYSPNKRGFGEILGTSMMQAQGMQRQRQEEDIMNRYREAQIGALSGKNNQPSSVQEYEYAKQQGFKGSFQDWIVAGGQSSRPSSVQEWEFFNALPKADQDRYLTMKRAQMQKVEELAGGKSVVTSSPLGNVTTTPLTSVTQEASGAGQIAAGTAAGKVAGETGATAQFDLPRVEDNAKQTLKLLDRLEKHPGRVLATGASSAVPLEKLPGTSSRDFVTLLGQLRGKQFLEAFNMLKGGGQITEVEGKKAEDAIATIQDRGQSEEAYLQAIQDLRQVVNDGVSRARKKAGAGGKPATEDPLGIR